MSEGMANSPREPLQTCNGSRVTVHVNSDAKYLRRDLRQGFQVCKGCDTLLVTSLTSKNNLY